jgi:hypothetical protein
MTWAVESVDWLRMAVLLLVVEYRLHRPVIECVTSIDPSLSNVTADWARAQPCNTDFNGAFSSTLDPKGGGSAESLEDVLRFGSLVQDEIGVRSGNHRMLPAW